MKAVGCWTAGLPASDPQSLVDLDLPDTPAPTRHDLLVRIHAVTVYPRDVKSRMALAPQGDAPMVIGYDASGIVVATGPDAPLFKPGDAVIKH